jgi:hypothetical protein
MSSVLAALPPEEPQGPEPGSAERRESRDRRPVNLRAYGVFEDEQTVDVTILDLSYEGCAIECGFEVKPGDRMKLYVIRRGAIDSTVRWVRDGKAGLVFDNPETEAPKKHWPRRSERVAISAEAKMRRMGRANYSVNVYDLSPHGCKAEFVDRPAVDEHVLIKFNGLEIIEAEVCWLEDHHVGLRFEKAMHPAVFDLLAERLR